MIFYIIAIILGVLMVIQSLRSRTAEDYSNVYVGLAVVVVAALMWLGHITFNWGWNLTTGLFVATVVVFIGVFVSSMVLMRVLFFILLGLFLWLGLGATIWVFVLAVVVAIIMAVYMTTVVLVGAGLMMLLAIAVAGLLAVTSVNPMPVHTATDPMPNVNEDANSHAGGNAKLDLTIRPGELIPTRAKCTQDVYSRNSLPGTKGRLWTDSVSTPFKADTKGAELDELLAEICTNPTLGDAYAQALSQGTIGDFSVQDANPWLVAFMRKTEKSGMEVWLTHKEKDGKLVKDSKGANVIYVTKAYQSNAERVNTLLLALDNQGVQKDHPSTTHWPSMSLVAGAIPRAYAVTDKSKQENKPFLALAFTTKVGEKCPFVLGVNIKDKRPEYVACTVAKKIAPHQPTQPQVAAAPRTTPTAPAKPVAKHHKVTKTEVTQKPTKQTKPKPHKVTEKPKTTPHKTTPKPTPKPHKPTPHKPKPSPKPSPSPSPTPSPSPSPSPSPKPSPSPSPKPKPSPSPKPSPKPKPPKTCTWKNGSVHELDKNGLCPKEPSVIPRNEHHDPAPAPSSKPEKAPVTPTQKATPSPRKTQKPDGNENQYNPPRSTQKAPGATPKATAKPSANPDTQPKATKEPEPKYTEPAPTVDTKNDEDHFDTAPCKNPVTGEAC